MKPVLVVPTHTHPPMLDALVNGSGMPAVVVLTRPGLRSVAGAMNVEDLGPVNIHRWWNLGIRVAESQGADVAVVVNHDVEAAPGALMQLVAELDRTGATLAHPGGGGVMRGGDRVRRLNGWCFALNLLHGLRPSDEFLWWFGDDWLCWQARVNHHGLVGVQASVQHRNPAPGFLSPEFAAMVQHDQQRWDQLTR